MVPVAIVADFGRRLSMVSHFARRAVIAGLVWFSVIADGRNRFSMIADRPLAGAASSLHPAAA
jgi:hypothetical protein